MIFLGEQETPEQQLERLRAYRKIGQDWMIFAAGLWALGLLIKRHPITSSRLEIYSGNFIVEKEK